MVGANSSGKSTFLRSFPLLRQSVDSRTTGPILWNGDYVDLGNFSDALRTGSDGTITLGFKYVIPASKRRSRRNYLHHSFRSVVLEDIEFIIDMELCQDNKDDPTRVRGCSLSFGGQTIVIRFSKKGTVSKFKVNELDILELGDSYSAVQANNFIPLLQSDSDSDSDLERRRFFGRTPLLGSKISSALLSTLRPLFWGNTDSSTIRSIGRSIGLGTDSAMLEDMKGIRTDLISWQRKVNKLSTSDRQFRKIRDLRLADLTSFLLDLADRMLDNFASGVHYIAPVRATAERYYRKRDLAVDQVDARGENMAMFLLYLTQTERSRFQEWTKEHLGFYINTKSRAGHVSLTLRELGGEEEYNLADVGFGFSQILPIVTQLWSLGYQRSHSRRGRVLPTLYAIEQPELHLHPRLQAKVADIFAASVHSGGPDGSPLPLMVETHSHTIVNRLGQHIAEDRLDADDVQVMVFERESPSYASVRISEYDEDGFLRNWPYGFFEPERALT